MSDWQSIRGDAASLPTDPMNMTFRPGGVTFVGVLVYLVAGWQALVGAFAIITAISSDQKDRFFKGQYLGGVSDGYLWFWGLVAIALAFLFFTLARTVLLGDDFARTVIIALAVLNIVLALFSFPWGIASVILNVLVIVLLTSPKATRWFNQIEYNPKAPNAFM
jgi:hypothetical protein